MRLYQNKYPISEDAKYVIDYVTENQSGENFYYQLVRLSDNAILYSNKKLEQVELYCWVSNIPHNQVSII